MFGQLKRFVDIYERRLRLEEEFVEIRRREAAAREREAASAVESDAENRATTRDWRRAIHQITADLAEVKAGLLVVRAQALPTGSKDT